jgi:putative ABC transport system substrate-binding protein
VDRRAFVAGTLALLAGPHVADAQPTGRVYRIGWLTPTVLEGTSRAFREALRTHGHVEGQTVAIELRSAGDDLQRLPRLAAELVQSRVDVIVAVSAPAILAARQATDAIPIVMAFWGTTGLIESGIVTSFARPGGNVTGVHMLAAELDAKRLELLLEALPTAKTVAVLNPERGWGETAARRHIPAVYEWGEIARAGGLMAYGPVIAELNRRVAAYVDKILRGARPGDLPIERPTKFELVINLKMAKALGLTIPPSVLARADEIIQ